MDITPAIRTAQSAKYLAYLQSPEWRSRRNTALRDAGFRCQQCASKRELQVHHKTYERLGAELLEDLEVLCAGCHEKHHLDEGKVITPIGLYLRVIAEVLRTQKITTYVDLSETVKEFCAKHHIAYTADRVQRAIEIGATKGKWWTWQPSTEIPAWHVVERAPVTPEDARAVLRQLGVLEATSRVLKPMPAPVMISQREVDQRRAMEYIAQEMQASIDRCAALEREVAGSPRE